MCYPMRTQPAAMKQIKNVLVLKQMQALDYSMPLRGGSGKEKALFVGYVVPFGR